MEITIVEVKLLEESHRNHRNCDKISGCYQLYECMKYIYFIVSPLRRSPLPNFRGEPGHFMLI